MPVGCGRRQDDGGSAMWVVALLICSTMACHEAPAPQTPSARPQPAPVPVGPRIDVSFSRELQQRSACMVTVDARPVPADVSIDGAPTGRSTPTSLVLNEGRHTILLTNRLQRPFRSTELKLQLSAGEIRHLHIELDVDPVEPANPPSCCHELKE